MSGSGGVEQGAADYLGAIGRRIYVQPPVYTFRSFCVASVNSWLSFYSIMNIIYLEQVSIFLAHAIPQLF